MVECDHDRMDESVKVKGEDARQVLHKQAKGQMHNSPRARGAGSKPVPRCWRREGLLCVVLRNAEYIHFVIATRYNGTRTLDE